jgi:hypothetical protein
MRIEPYKPPQRTFDKNNCNYGDVIQDPNNGDLWMVAKTPPMSQKSLIQIKPVGEMWSSSAVANTDVFGHYTVFGKWNPNTLSVDKTTPVVPSFDQLPIGAIFHVMGCGNRKFVKLTNTRYWLPNDNDYPVVDLYDKEVITEVIGVITCS